MSQKIELFITRATWRYVPEDGALHDHRCENLTARQFYRILNPRRIQMILWNRPGIPNGIDKIKLRKRERDGVRIN
jgi:hypothetical protein